MKLKITPSQLRNLSVENEATKNCEPKGEALLGIDFGEKFCGLAFSPDSLCVFPIGIEPISENSEKQFLENLEKVIQQKKIKKIVLGLPLSQNKKENHICKKVRDLAKILQTKFRGPIVLQNEHGSTQASQIYALNKQDRIDDLAAVKILEFYLGQKN